MRKVFFVLICFTAVAAVHAAGISEFRGQHYLTGHVWPVIEQFASGQDVSGFGINSVISNNKLHFVVTITTFDLPRGRGSSRYIQEGDAIRIFEDVPRVRFIGQPIYIRDLFEPLQVGMTLYAFGQVQFGGEIAIVNIVSERQLLMRGADQFREVEPARVLPGMQF